MAEWTTIMINIFLVVCIIATIVAPIVAVPIIVDSLTNTGDVNVVGINSSTIQKVESSGPNSQGTNNDNNETQNNNSHNGKTSIDNNTETYNNNNNNGEISIDNNNNGETSIDNDNTETHNNNNNNGETPIDDDDNETQHTNNGETPNDNNNTTVSAAATTTTSLVQTLPWLRSYNLGRTDTIGFTGVDRKTIVISASMKKQSLFQGLKAGIVYKYLQKGTRIYDIVSIITPNIKYGFTGFTIKLAQAIDVSPSSDYPTSLLLSRPVVQLTYQTGQELMWLPIYDPHEEDTVGFAGADTRKTIVISSSTDQRSLFQALKASSAYKCIQVGDRVYDIASIVPLSTESGFTITLTRAIDSSIRSNWKIATSLLLFRPEGQLSQKLRWSQVDIEDNDMIYISGEDKQTLVLKPSGNPDSLFAGLKASANNDFPYDWLVIDNDAYAIDSIVARVVDGFTIRLKQAIAFSDGKYPTWLAGTTTATTTPTLIVGTRDRVNQTLTWLPAYNPLEQDTIGFIGGDRKTLGVSLSTNQQSLFQGLKAEIAYQYLVAGHDIYEIVSIRDFAITLKQPIHESVRSNWDNTTSLLLSMPEGVELSQTLQWLKDKDPGFILKQKDTVGLLGPKTIVITRSSNRDSLFVKLQASIIDGLPYKWLVLGTIINPIVYEIASIVTPGWGYHGFTITLTQAIAAQTAGSQKTALLMSKPRHTQPNGELLQLIKWLPAYDLGRDDTIGFGTDKRTIVISSSKIVETSEKTKSLFKGLEASISDGLPYRYLAIHNSTSIDTTPPYRSLDLRTEYVEIQSITANPQYFLIHLKSPIQMMPRSGGEFHWTSLIAGNDTRALKSRRMLWKENPALAL